nr:MAG TPA: hypothetical protein [Caudoviricetes sp.]
MRNHARSSRSAAISKLKAVQDSNLRSRSTLLRLPKNNY